MKRFFAAVCAVCLAAVFAACMQASSKSEVAPMQLPVAAPYNISSLTGKAFSKIESRGIRPTAVVVDNVRAALPQRGLANAKIVYEALYSGGITHLLAVFDDYTLMSETGPVTTLDAQFAALTLPLDAICLSTSVTSAADGIITKHGKSETYINGSYETLALSLDSDRNSTADISHCWFTNGTLLSNAVSQYGIESYSDERIEVFNFVPAGTARALDTDASCVKIRFSGYTNTELDYKESYGKYYKSQFDGTNQLDANTSQTLCFDNVIVLFGDILQSDSETDVFDFASGGDGYYFYGGKCESITFEKPSDNAMLSLKNADGTALINRGTTYVALVDNAKRKHFEIIA